MKVFIVFLAFVMLSVSCLCFNSDYNSYVQLQNHMKALAEDAAVGSALILDGTEYAKGRLVIDEANARSYVDFLLQEAKKGRLSPERGVLSWTLEIFDDEKGYEGCGVYGLSAGKPSAVVSITFSSENLFRLKIFDMKKVTRTASYQWEF